MPLSGWRGSIDLEDHVVAVLELAHHGVELILGAGGLLVDAHDDQARLKALQVGKRAGADRLDDHAGDVELGGSGVGLLTHHQTQLGLAGIALVVGPASACWLAWSAKTLSRSPMVTVVSICLPSRW